MRIEHEHARVLISRIRRYPQPSYFRTILLPDMANRGFGLFPVAIVNTYT